MGQVISVFPTTHHQESFSRREVEILGLIHQGLSNDEIARQLYLSLETVKWYNKQIYGKLGVNSRTQAIARARDHGLIETSTTSPTSAQPRPKHNLPATLNATIGRQQELADLRRLLMAEMPRLITLVGFGGVGKTRLALETAAQVVDAFPQGVWWVELAPLPAGKLVAGSVAALFGLQQEQNRPIEGILQEYLRSRHLLLVLDNCEHLITSCAQLVEDLLRTCPQLRILATSRETLGCTGEIVYPVPTLSLPQVGKAHTLDELSGHEAVQLFTTRAKAIAPTFTLTHTNAPHIAHICRRLDGIPLALELAAARLNVLGIEQLATHLDESFGVLTSFSHTALPRHQTLQACLDWSYHLLSQPERMLLRRLTVFSGGWTLEAAEAICSDETLPASDVLDVLTHLVLKSLVQADPLSGCAARYHLHEIIRQYADAKMADRQERHQVREKHLDYFVDFMDKVSPKFVSAERLVVYPCCYAELDNFRAALHWALDEPGNDRVEDGLRLAVYLSEIWEMKGMFVEGHAWLSKGITRMDASGVSWTGLRASALNAFGHVTGFAGQREEAIKIMQESVALYRTCHDVRGLIMALISQGQFYTIHENDLSHVVLDEALALCREYDDPWLMALTLTWSGHLAFLENDYELAKAYLQDSLADSRYLGDEVLVGYAVLILARISSAQGEMKLTRKYLDEFLPISMKDIDRTLDILASFSIAEMAYQLKDFKLLETFYREKQATFELWSPYALDFACRCVGLAARHLGDLIQSAESYLQALKAALTRTDNYTAKNALAGLAGTVLDMGNLTHAACLFGAVEASSADLEWQIEPILIWQQELDRDLANIKASLPPEEFAQAWAEGQQMTLEQAVADALNLLASENDGLGA